jgi:two-component system, cell cycle response regulator
MKVLIVDDSEESLRVARARLAKEGVDIVCADGAEAGLDVARRERPDLVLLDVDMPGLSGFEVCHRMKSDPDLSLIPVIFLSGAGTAEDKVRGLDLGAVDYVTKPFDAFELRARVRAALRTKRLQDLLIQHAHLDPLTSLPNRRALDERLGLEWARVERHGAVVSFIMADIDHFKRVNDSYGHSIGDRMLQEVAKAIAGQCRDTDLAIRYGGEEFAVLVPDETADAAVHLAERCRRRIEAIRLSVGQESVAGTASFGVADSLGVSSAKDLIRSADTALYEAKRAGRNVVRVVNSTAPAADLRP